MKSIPLAGKVYDLIVPNNKCFKPCLYMLTPGKLQDFAALIGRDEALARGVGRLCEVHYGPVGHVGVRHFFVDEASVAVVVGFCVSVVDLSHQVVVDTFTPGPEAHQLFLCNRNDGHTLVGRALCEGNTFSIQNRKLFFEGLYFSK